MTKRLANILSPLAMTLLLLQGCGSDSPSPGAPDTVEVDVPSTLPDATSDVSVDTDAGTVDTGVAPLDGLSEFSE